MAPRKGRGGWGFEGSNSHQSLFSIFLSNPKHNAIDTFATKCIFFWPDSGQLSTATLVASWRHLFNAQSFVAKKSF
jgi:hypothetical protein